MSAHLARKTPGTKGVEGAIDREIAKALATLERDWPLSDEAVHGARKRLKRARAALRLARGGLGDRVYRRENQALRDAARPLSAVRDAAVLIQTLDHLELDPDDARRLRDGLLSHQRDARQKALPSRARLEPLLSTLRASRKHVDRAQARRHGWEAIGPGLRRTYRTARRTYVEARRNPSAERLHEWRKQTKYWWHILQLIQPIWPAGNAARARRAHRLSSLLGEDHDLFVLRRRSVSPRLALMPSTRAATLERIDRRRRTLQKRAMVLGAVVYRDRPRTLERRLHRRWRDWRSG